MPDARADALSLLATPQLGTFLTPDQREVVLRALADVEKLKRRVESAEAQLQAIRAALNGNPGVPAPKEAPQPPAAPPPTVQAAGGSTDEMCKCEHPRSAHAGGETFCVGDGEFGPPAKGNCWCLKFQPRESPQGAERGEVQEEAGGDRGGAVGPERRRGAEERMADPGMGRGLEDDQRAGGPERLGPDHPDAGGRPQGAAGGLDHSRREGGVLPLQAGHLHGDVRAGVADQAAAKWGRVRDPDAAWHLWLEDAGEAECGEATDAEIEFLPEGQGMDPETVCLDCRDIEAEERAENAVAIHARPLPPKEPKPRCAGHNKSANVPCHTERVSIQYEGKWFCKRHNPAKRAAAKVEAALGS